MRHNSSIKTKTLLSFNSTGPVKRYICGSFSLKFIIVYLLGICNINYSDRNDNHNINNNNNNSNRDFFIVLVETVLNYCQYLVFIIFNI